MRLVVLLTLLLSGCSSINYQEQALRSYLSDSAAGLPSSSLVGDAKQSQLHALELISSLGWSQSGTAGYSHFKSLGEASFQFCLNVEEISFMDSEGEPIPLARSQENLLMLAETQGSGENLRISSLVEVGSCS